ncbi:unnamed protein product [Fraxinus pennsylvanica]|uniref:Carotenoid isomerase n=1 Tax=Fraxinus pennsylvanica TaxID=56036 RepID=A0AAD1ZF94_9LAMI|nr:unnamed protein product [Fraxinus pennsylvanica]
MGALVAASQLAVNGAKGNLNLITQALVAVGCRMPVIPGPTTVHYHLPNGLSVRVHREYSDFVDELVSIFPHEEKRDSRILWSMLEAYYFPQNVGDIARNYIKDPQLLSFIDAECFIVSTVNSPQTPMINAGMVLCDRHFRGINYPVGGIGEIAKALAKGLVNQGSKILYKANATNIILENGKAVSLSAAGASSAVFSMTSLIIKMGYFWQAPDEEERFQKAYVKAPSFLSVHMAVKADVLPPDTDCHHFILEDDWKNLEKSSGSIFLSIPTVLDSLSTPEGNHSLHIFTTSSIEDWEGLSSKDYEAKKEIVAEKIINRLEKKLFPGLKSSNVFKEIGTPKTPRRYLAHDSGTHGLIPRRIPKGLIGMPFNTTVPESLSHLFLLLLFI